ncbi:DUF6090 family protein [Formosa maritima]|uniref:Uncharacterized protein n=1 Tax=Formosa maritima TaxID=2592046 RepID=A0A5D0GES7_9FLAO|nr:DUF6090 family protein [Formosa maritima]TYA57508.1 hypothetical protein FVF61_04580 [Formosa maritima]
MSKNKTTKYFKYAIGEIILVVIGILIALQLNAWKSDVNQRRLEQLHLKNIKEDLQFQLEIIEQQMEHDSIYSQRTETAFSYFRGDITFTQLEELLYGANNLGYRKTFVESEASFNELLSTGGMSLIKDHNLRKLMMHYYQQLKYTSKVINANNGLIDQMFNLHSTNSSPMFSLDKNGQLDTTKTFTGQELYRLKQTLLERSDLCEIALKHCEKQRIATIALISEVNKNIKP